MSTIITAGAESARGYGFGTSVPKVEINNWDEILMIPYREGVGTPYLIAFYDFVAEEFVHEINISSGPSYGGQLFRHYDSGNLVLTSRGRQVVRLISLQNGSDIWSVNSDGYSSTPYAKDRVVSISKSGTTIYAYTSLLTTSGITNTDGPSTWFTTTDTVALTSSSNPDLSAAHSIDGNFEMQQTGNIYVAASVPDTGGSGGYKHRVGLGYVETDQDFQDVSDVQGDRNYSRPAGGNGDGIGMMSVFDNARNYIYTTSLGSITPSDQTTGGNGYVRPAGTRNSTYPFATCFHWPYETNNGDGTYTGRTKAFKYNTSGVETSVFTIDDNSSGQFRGGFVQTIPAGCIFCYQDASGTPKYRKYTASSDSLGSEQSFVGATWSNPCINYTNGQGTIYPQTY